MRTAAARVGRPIEWDEREDAPRLAEPVRAAARAALLQAAVHLDDPKDAGDGWRAIDPERDEAVAAARLMLRRTRFPHLLRSGEVFLPVGFDRPIDLLKSPVGATVLGSASRLVAELEQVRDELTRSVSGSEDAGAPRGAQRSGESEILRKTAPAVEEALEPLLRLARESVARRLPLIVVG
jgi:hypothetical protein